ncbi:MAG: hypothetical protein ABR536_02435, partial [Solirubrobacterales bacterium]
YLGLAQAATSAGEADTNIKAAAQAQQIVADAKPSQGAFSNLAIYLYFAGDTAAADEAAKKAAAAAEPAQAASLAKSLEQLKAQAAKFREQVKSASKPPKGGAGAAAPGEPATTNPFSNPLQSSPSLGSGGLGG